MGVHYVHFIPQKKINAIYLKGMNTSVQKNKMQRKHLCKTNSIKTFQHHHID